MEKKNESIAISLIALIIGILAIVLSWVPIVNNLAAIFAIIGLIFGIIAVVINRKNKKTIGIVAIVVSIISFIIVLATQTFYSAKIDEAFKTSDSSSNISKTTGKATEESKSEAKKEDSGWDEATKTFTTNDGVLKIDKVEKTTDYDGKAAIKVYFTLTNTSTENKDAQMLFQELTRVQQKSANTSNDLQYTMMPIENTEENHLSDNINPNGTISGYYPYLLENETDPIQFLFEKNYKAVATYEVALN
ncbi:DUF5067 domain-containing protein [Lactococcus raffinolactis]|uniref:DUF5067 domain-containing protein n=1 Tax=Pseudolactococcus raffinolactis TaxID=1366 RepID=UPI00241677C6|nr:DUF5067 domain-containing protein [Lactococcus raffinolactis]MDG4961528.1 DUF5067 domain-containing protein [Lactococcus raffinolactis]